jgi:hypothetical protein
LEKLQFTKTITKKLDPLEFSAETKIREKKKLVIFQLMRNQSKERKKKKEKKRKEKKNLRHGVVFGSLGFFRLWRG